MQIEMRPIGQLVPYARNARTHSEEQIAQIAASIAEFGFTNPILIGEDAGIIAGHGRLLAAQRLGLSEVPTITLAHLSETQRRALVIADNRIAENAGWDEDLLAEELAALQELQFDLDLVGFSETEIADLLGEADGPGFGAGLEEDAEEDIPDLPEAPVTRPGDLWCLGEQRLLCADSTDAAAVARLMGSARARLLFTSPPYGQQRDYGAAKAHVGDWDRLMRGVFSAAPMAPDGQVLVNLGLVHRDGEWLPYWEHWLEWMRTQGWRRFGWYVWDQGAGLPGDWVGRFAPSHEFIFHFNREARKPNKTHESTYGGAVRSPKSKGLRKADGSFAPYTAAGEAIQAHKIPDSVVRVTRHKGAIRGGAHPAVFPLQLAREMIAAWSDPGDVLYEPFTGSGSQLIAATELGRHCFGIEIDPAYVDVAVRRWQITTGGTATHGESGESFETLAAARALETA